MADPLQGFEPGSTYGAYRDPDYTRRSLEAELKKKKAKAAQTKKPTQKPAAKPQPKRNEQTWNPAQV